jgi:protein-disulfide isomerase
MHDLLFENQRSFGDRLFSELAESLGLDSAQLKADLEARTYRARIRADFAGGVRSGVNGTPTFFINGKRHNGSPDFESLVHAIEGTPVV